jgi:hypothetical protein
MNASKAMTHNVKTYLVSLACMVPHNFECLLKAENELEAFKKGRELFYEGKEGEIEEISPGEISLDLSDEDAEDEIPLGAHVEQIEEDGD